MKQQPLWEKLYQRPEYYELVRKVGYVGCTVRELFGFIEELAQQYGKATVESAFWHCLMYEGQMSATPKPLAHVYLRADVRKLSFQLLGPPPEQWESWASPFKEPPPNPYKPVEPEPEPKKPARRKKVG